MTKKACVSMLILFVFSVFGKASEQNPAAVSPGQEIGNAVISDLCPTFSWTAVDWATAYRIEVFPAEDEPELVHNKISASSYPLIVKEIPGAATSWTPSMEEGLNRDGNYIWFVAALDAQGSTQWSPGKSFVLDRSAGFAAIERSLEANLRDYGMDNNSIQDILSDIKADSGVSPSDAAMAQSGTAPISIQGSEGTDNTYYGSGAGASLTTGYFNAFLGNNAGNVTTTGDNNTFLGHNAGKSNTAAHNTFVGSQAGVFNTSGQNNTFVGEFSGFNNLTAGSNTYVGEGAGYRNTTGYDITILGFLAGYENLANYNTFIGSQAGYSNTTGTQNLFLGWQAGYTNTAASSNTFLGSRAGYNNTSGYNNTFVGQGAGYSNTEGYYNVFLGKSAGYSNTDEDRNTFLGYNAGYANQGGGSNTFVGSYSGRSNTSGNRNTALGEQAGYLNTTGFDNTFIGQGSGNQNTTGYYNTYVGRTSGYNATGNLNVFLGYSAGYNEAGSHKLYIENSNSSDPLIYGEFDNNVVAFMGTVGVGTKSPAYPMEMKKTGTNASIVVDRTDGATNFINATDSYGNFGTVTDHPLRLVANAVWRMRLNTDNSLQMKNGATCTAAGVWTNASSRDLKENIKRLSAEEAEAALRELDPVKYNYKTNKADTYVGFIAEDVPELVASQDRKGMSPMDVVAVLTKVLQEQQSLNEELLEKIDQLESEVEELRGGKKLDK